MTGPRSDQPLSVQYAVKSVEAGDLEVDHPLGRRDVAVEPGHQHPHREAVVDRQRLAVHRDRQHRVGPGVGELLQRGAAGPAVPRGLQHRVGAALDAGLGEQRVDPDAAPPGVADQRAADGVGHAVERQPVLGDLPVDELLVGQRDLAVDHAVDAQAPLVGLDRGRGDRGVDQVEPAVRRLPPAVAGRVHPRAARRVRVGHRQLEQAPALLDVPPLPAEPLAEDADHGGQRRGDPGPDQERTAGVGVLLDGAAALLRGLGAGVLQRVGEERQHHDPGDRAGRDRQHVERAGVVPRQHREQARRRPARRRRGSAATTSGRPAGRPRPTPRAAAGR